jgi:hypothetical protein
MIVRSANDYDGQSVGPPPPPPTRWHLRTQVSRKTLFDLIQDTLPPAGIQVAGAPDGGPTGTQTGGGSSLPPPGVLPQSYLDSVAATIPMPLNAAALWNDGDTTPDLPQHFRPITITLASQPALPSNRPALPAPRPLDAVIKRAAWMLSGVALTFLIGAAAFGGRPMFQAMRSVLSRSQAHAATPPAPSPATPVQATPVHGPGEAAGRALVATAGPTVVPIHTESAGTSALDAEVERARMQPDGSPPRKADVLLAARVRRSRRAPVQTSDADRDSAMADDAVMPLESAPLTSRSPPARAAAVMARTRALRPIDFEDPFGGP